jgi:hypothetical protein
VVENLFVRPNPDALPILPKHCPDL